MAAHELNLCSKQKYFASPEHRNGGISAAF